MGGRLPQKYEKVSVYLIRKKMDRLRTAKKEGKIGDISDFISKLVDIGMNHLQI